MPLIKSTKNNRNEISILYFQMSSSRQPPNNNNNNPAYQNQLLDYENDESLYKKKSIKFVFLFIYILEIYHEIFNNKHPVIYLIIQDNRKLIN